MLLIDPTYVQRVKTARSAPELHTLVQTAIKLEHSTIPPYLCAYFTLKTGTNIEAARIIRSVVVEEMLHLTIAANLLIAIGGSPEINRPRFIPTYPGHLPMGIGGSLNVGLKKCSLEQIENVFMAIEEPEHPLDFPIRAEAFALVPQTFATIGQFYAAIVAKLEELGPGAFTGDVGRQVIDPTWFPAEELFPIKDPESARAAIDIIVEQGEGTPVSPVDPEGEVAHYYRFAEIVKGRALAKDPSVPQGWSYSGAPIVLDTANVWNMQDDPKVARYPSGTRARFAADAFNAAYAKVLNTLHITFNGAPDSLSDAMGLMYDLRFAAQEALAITVPGAADIQTGLSFECPAFS